MHAFFTHTHKHTQLTHVQQQTGPLLLSPGGLVASASGVSPPAERSGAGDLIKKDNADYQQLATTLLQQQRQA